MLALAIALTGLVAWWWTETADLLGQWFLDTGHVTIGGDVVFGGIAVGLQIFAGLLMFMAAFPLSDEAFADDTGDCRQRMNALMVAASATGMSPWML